MTTISGVVSKALLGLVAVVTAVAMLGEVKAGNSSLYHLRTEPATPIAGQPFNVVAQSGPCESLFVGDPTGSFQYGGVTTSEGIVTARWGSQQSANCQIPITTVRQTVPGLASGTYTVQLMLQQFPPPAVDAVLEAVVESIQIQVIGAAMGSAQIPAWSWVGALGLCLSLTLAGLVALRQRT